MNATSMLDHALKYIQRGKFIVPLCWPTIDGNCACGRGHTGKDVGKAPLLGSGWQNLRSAETDVRSWWQRWPNANIGILLEPSGLLVLDIDSEAGGIEAHKNGLPSGPTVKTGSGEHHYFSTPAGVSGRTTKRGESRAMDVLAAGFVVAPPSLHRSGRRYTWEQSSLDSPLTEPPKWIVDLLVARPTANIQVPPIEKLAVAPAIDQLNVSDRIKALIRLGRSADTARYASRSEAVFAVVQALVAGSHDDSIIVAILLDPANGISEKPRAQGREWLASEIMRAKIKSPDQDAPNNEPAIPWPEISPEAFYGLAGEIIRAIEPHTESDPFAILIQLLAAFGNVIHRTAHFVVEADRHYLKLFVVLVGLTSKGRKGTSWGHVSNLLKSADPAWAETRVLSGLSSGEGLIWAVRDPISKREAMKEGKRVVSYQDVETDPGVTDKRLLAYESEFASILRVLDREGNTLSAIIRQAWDDGNLRSLTKNSPAVATNAHISIVGHITKDELLRYMDSTEAGNGFGNRILWPCVKRSKYLPDGGQIQKVDFAPFLWRLNEAIRFAQTLKEPMKKDAAAATLWHEVYMDLSTGKPGLLGAVTSRAEAQVMRLACLLAVLDLSAVIRKEHLNAALAIWKYCEDSCRYIFGDSLGDPMADTLLQALRIASNGLTRTEINNLFGRHKDGGKLGRALAMLSESGMVRRETRETDGRPAEVWIAMRPAKKAKEAK